MKSFQLGEGEVLMVRRAGTVTAVGSKCTHYGAPLEKGALGPEGTIRCPWHGACFNSVTGDIEDFPGLDSLPCYKVSLEPKEGGDRRVKVRARPSQLLAKKRVQPLATKNPDNGLTIVVVGGGAAGNSCVEGLRQEGFTGRVVMVCGESALPYDRPKISKNLIASVESLALRTKEFYEMGDIELITGNPVLSLNSANKKLLLKDGKSLSYDHLFLATGGRPITLREPGSELPGVLTLRTPADGLAILQQTNVQHVVIVGTSFIGMEVASHLMTLGKCASVSVVGRGSVPYERSLGTVVGRRLQQFLEEQGVTFYMNDGIAEIVGRERVEQVVLKNGAHLEAGIVICGIGVQPATDFLEGSEVQLDDRGYVVVDQFLRTSVGSVYSGGDIAVFPLQYGGAVRDDRAQAGHWQIAQYHGHVAAHNLLSSLTNTRLRPVNTVPMFWTVLQGKSLRYAGYGKSFDDVIVTGDLEGLSFLAYYLKNDSVVALASLGKDPAVARFAEHFRNGGTLTRQQVVRVFIRTAVASLGDITALIEVLGDPCFKLGCWPAKVAEACVGRHLEVRSQFQSRAILRMRHLASVSVDVAQPHSIKNSIKSTICQAPAVRYFTARHLQYVTLQPGTCSTLLYSQAPAAGCATARHLQQVVLQPGTCSRLCYSQAPAAGCATARHLQQVVLQPGTCSMFGCTRYEDLCGFSPGDKRRLFFCPIVLFSQKRSILVTITLV
ncbi:FAD/NAD(P)-binding domain [Trinorchestia longiramus]|nr:FAD/NAD(P)-binding domain [Trinorchestia longiramus]